MDGAGHRLRSFILCGVGRGGMVHELGAAARLCALCRVQDCPGDRGAGVGGLRALRLTGSRGGCPTLRGFCEGRDAMLSNSNCLTIETVTAPADIDEKQRGIRSNGNRPTTTHPLDPARVPD